MRSTLACQWCRNAKIKCHHNGAPPCRSCSVYPGRECVLSKPRHQSKRQSCSPKITKGHSIRDSGALVVNKNRGTGIDGNRSLAESSDGRPDGDFMPRNNGMGKHGNIWDDQCTGTNRSDPLAGLSRKSLERAFHVFIRHFPEFGFFHQPTFLLLLDQGDIPNLLLCGILALSARFVPELATIYGTPGKTSEYFANHVRRNILTHAMTAMDIRTGQVLLMLSLYDWGNGNGSRAWTYNGMATRIVHGAYAQAKETATVKESPLNNSRLEEACRTVWACFLLDSMIGCGKCQASDFSMTTSRIPLPSNEEQFAFGDSQPSPIYLESWDPEVNDYHPPDISSLDKMGCDRIPSLIVQGFSIWQSVSSWVSTGGRRRETPSSREPPWRECSFWSRSMAALKDWRAHQSPQLMFSVSNMNLQVYIARGEGERFAITNLLYYLNLIFLHRAYIPFIPHSISGPQGPIDPPLLVDEAPLGWWDQSAQEMFAAASNIIQIMRDLDRRGIQFQTPFTSFCVFTAATALSYADAWPYMAPGLDRHVSSDLLTWASVWLSQACEVWKVAIGWYRTLLALRQLYTQVRSDPTEVLLAGRDVFPDLEENLQRLAGSETLDPADIPTANILLLLQRQQGQIQSGIQIGRRLSTGFSENGPPQAAQTVAPHLPEVSTRDSVPGVWPLPVDAILDQDLFTGILSDPSGDWLSHSIYAHQLTG